MKNDDFKSSPLLIEHYSFTSFPGKAMGRTESKKGEKQKSREEAGNRSDVIGSNHNNLPSLSLSLSLSFHGKIYLLKNNRRQLLNIFYEKETVSLVQAIHDCV